MSDTKERRYKIAYIPHEFIIHFLTFMFSFNERDYIAMPIIKDLPKEGCEVKTVSYFPERDAFGFIIHHESFEPVPLGTICPEIIIKDILFKRVKNYERCETK